VQGVQNGTDADPVFHAYTANGTEVTLPVDINSNASTIAQITSIGVSLSVQAPNRDLESGINPQSNVRTTIRINNCSGATTGQTNSCQ
jgi:hypothetical protein